MSNSTGPYSDLPCTVFISSNDLDSATIYNSTFTMPLLPNITTPTVLVSIQAISFGTFVNNAAAGVINPIVVCSNALTGRFNHASSNKYIPGTIIGTDLSRNRTNAMAVCDVKLQVDGAGSDIQHTSFHASGRGNQFRISNPSGQQNIDITVISQYLATSDVLFTICPPWMLTLQVYNNPV